jgi:hypothetical protein
MGLMVANRRDEPSGGFQGISRARREGANPMMYGAAGGFVPNYAAGAPTGPDLAPFAGKTVPEATKKIQEDLTTALSNITKQYRAQLQDVKKNAKQIKDQIKLEDDKIKLLKDEIAASTTALGAAKAQGVNAIEINKEEGRIKNLENDLSNTQSSRQKITPIDVDKERKNLRESAVKKQAEERTNAAALTTAVSTNAKRGLTNPITPRVVDPKVTPGGNRDMLGTIFAVQGAMSALTGATEGATSGMAQLTNGVASAASTASTFLFAGQGLSQAFGGAATGAGKLIGKLGVYGAVIGGVVTAFNEYGKYVDSANPAMQKASEAALKLADAAGKASVNLSTLNPVQKDRVEKQASDLISGARNIKGGAYGVQRASIEGLSFKLNNDLKSGISQGLGVGVSYDEIYKEFNKYAESNAEVTAEEAESLLKFIEEKTSAIADKANVSKAIDFVKEQQKQPLSRKELEFGIKQSDVGTTELLQKFYKNSGITDDKIINENVRVAQAAIAGESQQKTSGEKEAIDQIKTSIAQSRLKNALENSFAEARKFENDLLAQQLLTAEELGDLDEKSLRNLKDRIALREIDYQYEEGAKSILQSQIDKAKSITADSTGADKLQNEFNLLNPGELGDKDKVLEILGKINKLLNEGEDLQKAQIESNTLEIDQLNTIKKRNGESLTSQQKSIALNKEKIQQLDLIAQASKRAQEAQSFNREIGATKSINANDLRVRALESSKLGASDSQIRQIDQQIAAIKANTVALEQGKEREKIFSQLKLELLENNKITDEDTRKIRDNKIQQISTPEALARAAKQVFLQQEGVDKAQQQQNLEKFIQNMNQLFDSFDVSSKIALAVAAGETDDAGRIAPVISALALFERSLLDASQIIDQKIEDIKLQQLTSISGRELLQGNYDIGTLNQQKGQTAEEAAKIARKRQVKSVSQLFGEEFGKTEEERAMDINKAIVDGSVQFKNNMIEGIMGAVEGTSSLKDGLRSAAYEFIKSINQKMMSNLVDKVVGGNVESGTGQTGGGIVGFLSGIFGSKGMASGGKVSGGSGSKDDVPAMLMGGEYVVNKKAVSKYGAQFMESINSGTLSGYAKGGKVQRGPQGNFYAPGTFGQGAISGKRNLLDFATQTGTSGKFDQMINESGYQSIDLESESSRLSVSGMRNSPMFDATQSAKGQAFDLYLQQYNAEREAKKQAKEQKKAFTTQLIMLAGSAALGGIGKAAMTGGSNAVKALGENAKFLDKASAFFGGMYKGGDIGSGIMGGGLKNLFSGNFGLAYQSEILKASPVSSITNKAVKSGVNIASGAAKTPGGVVQNSDTGYIPPDLPTSNLANTSTYLQYKRAAIQILEQKGFNQSGAANFLSTLSTQDIYSMVDKAEREFNVREKAYQNSTQPLFKATGGMIPSTSGVDTVPAMLSGGEFVMNRSAVQGIGASNLQSMNSGGTSITSEETSKELNEKLLAKLDELINSSGSAGNITINVAPSGQTTQDNSQDPSAGRQQLARQIKDAVLQIINDEKRIGGSLRR